ncbi:MAG: glycosyltransferase family 2 protein [Oscillospiraceae bacterium]|nr:glycosyltransferase family 2 protein [Oscillospiraceae bacterium]
MPEISVIVPVYKAEAYLHSCVDSILNQTFSDIEVFLVNDGSPDKCVSICDNYAQKDVRVRVIHQENQGQAAARNHALMHAAGKWICFVDSDDLIHPQMLQRLYDAAVTRQAGIAMCPMVEAHQLPENFYDQPEDFAEVLQMNEQTLLQLYDRDEYPSWVACAKLIRKEYIEKHFFCQGRVYEDNEAVCHWMYQTEKLIRLSAPMYYYRTNPGSTTQRNFSIKKLDYLWALENIIRFYDSVGYMDMKQRFALRYGAEVPGCANGLRYELQSPHLVKKLEKQTVQFVREQKIRLPLELREQIFDAVHPKLIRVYWPVKGIVKRIGRLIGKNKGDCQ